MTAKINLRAHPVGNSHGGRPRIAQLIAERPQPKEKFIAQQTI
jgi:hypothetical protein